MKTVKGTKAGELVDKLNHHNIHSNELLSRYSDLKIVYDGTQMDYYSALVNPEIDLLQFEREAPGTYIYTHVVMPYKQVQITCSQCEGKMRVNSIPSKIPFLMEHETVYNTEYVWYSTIYEEIFRLNNFSPMCLIETQLRVFTKLEEYQKNNRKVDTYLLTNSIKKLLPFT